jgi:exodeoxyribonuclease-3
MSIAVVTWNVNSIRARLDRLLAFLARHSPDAVCLQELTVDDGQFPFVELRAAGYHAVVAGQKTYNGVAILAKEEPTDVLRGLDDGEDDPQARLIAATVRGIRVASAYFPNGGEPTSPKYPYKLAWMRRLRRWLDRHVDPASPFVLGGDFNVAPEDLDIKNPAQWRDSVLANDEVRAALAEIRGFGLVDVLRKHHPGEAIYSWWDYRMLGFPKNDGLRIDHLDATPALAARSEQSFVDREERKGKQASDHAPVFAVFSE